MWVQAVYLGGEPRAHRLLPAVGKGGSGPLRRGRKVLELIPEGEGQQQFSRDSSSK